MDLDNLLACLNDACEQLGVYSEQLRLEPQLLGNWHWRENLESLGYEIMTALSTEAES